MIAYTLFKAAFSKIMAFIIAHWRVILPVLVLGYCLHLYFKEVNRADEAENALADFKAQIAQQTAARELENAKRFNLAQSKIAIASEKAKNDLQRLNLDRARETKNLKDYYENRIDTGRHHWNERLRIATASSGTTTTESASNTCTPAESRRDCNATITALEKACAITTIDYNELRAWGDTVCNTVVCEN